MAVREATGDRPPGPRSPLVQAGVVAVGSRRPFLGVGVLGGYTTLSTYMLDTRSLVVDDHLPLAAVYLFGTLIAGLSAVWVGVAHARRMSSAPPVSGTSS